MKKIILYIVIVLLTFVITCKQEKTKIINKETKLNKKIDITWKHGK